MTAKLSNAIQDMINVSEVFCDRMCKYHEQAETQEDLDKLCQDCLLPQIADNLAKEMKNDELLG